MQIMFQRCMVLNVSMFHSISHPEDSDAILKEVGDKLKTYPFDFKGATILTGQEEGSYGWVTVNYLLENFIKVKTTTNKEDIHILVLDNSCHVVWEL